MGQAPRGHGAGRAWGTGGGRWGRRDRDGTGTPSPLTPQGRGGAQAPTNTPCLGLLRRGTRTPGLPWGDTRRGDTRPQPPQVTSGGEAPPSPPRGHVPAAAAPPPHRPASPRAADRRQAQHVPVWAALGPHRAAGAAAARAAPPPAGTCEGRGPGGPPRPTLAGRPGVPIAPCHRGSL